MPFLRDELYYLPMTAPQFDSYEPEQNMHDNFRVNILPEEDISADVNYIPFDQAESYGRLRLMQDGTRPSPFDIAIYETLPNS